MKNAQACVGTAQPRYRGVRGDDASIARNRPKMRNPASNPEINMTALAPIAFSNSNPDAMQFAPLPGSVRPPLLVR